VATGTAPLTVASTTVVPNLNASYCGSYYGTTAATASTIAVRDANNNISARGFIQTPVSVATAAETTTLTIGSQSVIEFTGTTTQTVVLPTTSVSVGQVYRFVNNSTGAVTVQSSSAAFVIAIPAGYGCDCTALTSTPTIAAHWRAAAYLGSGIVPTSANSLAVFSQSTANTIGVGNIELGHATDTTLSRSAAGVVAVEGVPLLRVQPRIISVASAPTPIINVTAYDQVNLTALAAGTTIGTSGTALDGQKLMVRIKDNGTAQTVAWSASFQSSGVAVPPTATVAGKTHLVGFIYDSAVGRFVCVASDSSGY